LRKALNRLGLDVCANKVEWGRRSLWANVGRVYYTEEGTIRWEGAIEMAGREVEEYCGKN
jgi:hypothetical protein